MQILATRDRVGARVLASDRRQEPTAIQPFTIRVADPVLADLRARLAKARIPEPLQGDGWTHGTDIRYLRELVAYWRDRFDWRAQERRLNPAPLNGLGAIATGRIRQIR